MTCTVRKGRLGGLSGCMGKTAKGYVAREGRAGAQLRRKTVQTMKKKCR